MDLSSDLVGRARLEELRREAERARVLAAIDRMGGRERPVAATVGRWLVHAGSRLEALGAARSVTRPPVIVTDPCGGCAN